MTDQILVIISSFLGGSFLTAIGFVVGYANRLTKVEAITNEIAHKLQRWESKGMPSCTFHLSIENRLREVEIKVGDGK